MSELHIQRWLDNELDDSGMLQLESWLREEPDHLQQYFDAVRLQEEVRALYCERPSKLTLPLVQSRTVWRIVLLSTAAAILLAACLGLPVAGPKPTADPHLFVLAGNPQVQMTRTNPGPHPVAIPHEEWPTETLVATAEKASSVRWNEDYLLEVEPNSSLTLRSGPEDDVATNPPSIRLDRGGLTVKLAIVSAPIEILIDGSRVRVAKPTVFTLLDLGPQPDGPSVRLSVASGVVEVSDSDATVSQVHAGETRALP